MADTAAAPKPGTSPSDDADKPKRVVRPKLEATPLGMRIPKAPPLEAGGRSLNGGVRLGWLRQLTTTIPRTMPDSCVVVFTDEQTEVRP